MKVINVNEGPKMEYSTYKNKITFADELTVNLEKSFSSSAMVRAGSVE